MTTEGAASYARQWKELLTALKGEAMALCASERRWIGERLSRIAETQGQMHALFLSAEGGRICEECAGECCGCGRNHVTLATLLFFLLEGEDPPVPDFSLSCPYMGPQGCRFEAARRPYNCVSFLCSIIEERLAPESRSDFYRLEKDLRQLYLDFDRRYAGSSLRGIFIRAERLRGSPFLSRV